MREATPPAINVAGSAIGASESTMACDTGLVEPAPLRQASHNHFFSSCQALLRLTPTLAPALVLLYLAVVSSTTQPMHRNIFVELRKLYDVVVVEDGGASTSLSSS